MSMINVLVADETGAARGFFKGENTKDIKVGATIAIRNGARKIIKNHISLEIDLLGRVTIETVDIKPNTEHNISDV
jgi:ssDNA-binding replication factor A large subunit